MKKTKLFGIIIATVMILGVVAISQNQATSQETEEPDHESKPGPEPGMKFVDTETITLKGKLARGDFILLMDITGFVSKSGHVAMKVPCERDGDRDGKQLLTMTSGLAPDTPPIQMDYVVMLSSPPNSCVFHGEIPEGITDIILVNTSDDKIRFYNQRGSAGYTVTITIVAEEVEHNEH